MDERSGTTAPPGSNDARDDIVAALLRAHADLPPAESATLDRRLVLLLAMSLDDIGRVRAAIDTARTGLRGADLPGERRNAVLRGDPASTAAHSVGIALALKGIAVERRGATTPAGDAGKAPTAGETVLEIDGLALTQPLAIIAYLDETRPRPPLMPVEAGRRARLTALAQVIATEASPLDGYSRVGSGAGQAGDARSSAAALAKALLARRLAMAEALLENRETGPFAHGAAPGVADCCIVPQLLAARRLGVDLTPLPRLRAIEKACATLPAFSQTHPSNTDNAEDTTG